MSRDLLRFPAILTLCLIAACSGGHEPTPVAPDPQELLREGDARLAAGDYDAAAASLSTLLENYPQSQVAPQALFQLAAIYLSRDSPLYNASQGTRLLSETAERYRGSPLALAADAVLDLLLENVDLRYEDLAPETPVSESLLRRAEESLESDDVEGAELAFRQIIEEHPESRQAPEALFQLAVLQLDTDSRLHDRAAGREGLERLIDRYPDSTWSIAARALRTLSASNIDLRRAVDRLQDQLEQIKRIDLDSDDG